jgi:hypothetical protein
MGWIRRVRRVRMTPHRDFRDWNYVPGKGGGNAISGNVTQCNLVTLVKCTYVSEEHTGKNFYFVHQFHGDRCTACCEAHTNFADESVWLFFVLRG